MTQNTPSRTRRTGAMLVYAVALATGLLASASSMASYAFDSKMQQFVEHLKDDPGYKRIPLQSTADREWFYHLSEQVFEHKMTKEQFVSAGAERFPGYESSFSSVADFMISR